MGNLIITTPDELRAIVSEAVSGVMPKQVSSNIQIDTLTLNDALELLQGTRLPDFQSENLQTDFGGNYLLQTLRQQVGFLSESGFGMS